MRYDCIVLGGGIYGCHVALELRKQRLKVALFEPNELLSGATTVNQGRVHEGFHYPRSAATAMTAAKYYEKFLIDFAPAISQNTEHLYLIAKDSKVDPIDYEKVLDEIGASYKKVETPGFFNKDMIQQAYQTHEVAFDIRKLRNLLSLQLRLSGVDIIYDWGLIEKNSDGTVAVQKCSGGEIFQTDYIFNCTYSSIDGVVKEWRTKLRKEHVEVAFITVPSELTRQDITLMNGEFWSLMHYPPTFRWGTMAMTHVKYGRHQVWETPDLEPAWCKATQIKQMIEDASRYCPSIKEAKYISSMYTTRTLIADTMGDDSRPVVVEFDPTTPRIISILGSKFNSLYDLDSFLQEGEWAREP